MYDPTDPVGRLLFNVLAMVAEFEADLNWQSERVSSDAALLPVPDLAILRTRQSAKWRSFADDVLPLTVAEMDFELAEPIQAVLREAVQRSDTGYALPAPWLGEALAGFAAQRWDWSIDPGEVRAVTDVGVGAVELLRVLGARGRQVVISPPVYPPFFDWVAEAGGQLVEVPLLPPAEGGWRLDLPALEAAFRAGPAVYLLCNPHNPVGLVHRPEDLQALVELAARFGVRLIGDEIHAPLVLPGSERFTPLLSVPGAAELAVSLHSASKAWNLAGLKCAAVVPGAPAISRLLADLPPDSRWRLGHFGVLATVAAYRDGQQWLDRLLTTLQVRRDLLRELLADQLPDVDWTPPQATFLAWLDCRGLAAAGDPHERFLQRGRVALERGRNFGAVGEGFVRLNFATSEQILRQAVQAMAGALD